MGYLDDIEHTDALLGARLAAEERRRREAERARERQHAMDREAAERAAAEREAARAERERERLELARREAEAAKRAMRDRYVALGGSPGDFERDWDSHLRAEYMAGLMRMQEAQAHEDWRTAVLGRGDGPGTVEMENLK